MRPAGKLRHRLTVQAPSTSRDSRGRRGDTWTDVATAGAEIVALSGGEGETSRQLLATATHRVTMRYPRAYELTTKHRLKFGSRYFNIGLIQNLGELNRMVELLCSEERA